MSDTRARTGVEVQLGARARSILKTLSNAAPGGLTAHPAARRLLGAPSLAAREPARGSEPQDDEAALNPRERAKAARAAKRSARSQPEDGNAEFDRLASASPASNTVVPLPRRAAPKRGAPAPEPDQPVVPTARPVGVRRKRNVVKISAWLCIALPTALAALYYGVIASPQYVAEARFAVRGPAEVAGGSGDAIAAMTGLGTSMAGMASDSFIVAQYIESGQIVANMQRALDLRSIYTHENADFVAKYRPYDFDDTVEHLTRYWNSVSWVYYEPVTGIITFTVRAFTPEDALKVARETVRESENLVNKLSARARDDALMLAKQEQSRAELRLKFAQKAIQDYRDRQGAPDAQSLVEGQSKIVADLEGQLAKQEAELSASSAFLNKDAPTVRFMQKNVEALKSRIAAERAKIGSVQPRTGSKETLISASMAEFENLAMERDFAQKAYQQASQAVDAARITAERQSRYLATFVEPHLPEDSLYPARLQMILLVLVCSTIAWAIGALIFYGIRDHSA
ncbi:hypothetical protein [Hansschlegelia beijingensis]|uniref:Capsular polysaccharide transport system permease protein n=1 Tax=Hansschlegelia beijingensis TaxID=1133344 RepID=A0A7W6GGC9_9HYPH|nr:hypothetical protein [Hansschlegelia beijingensis]MBB3973968.1 capsular polysaccharide transport system permease protein [Hansschlegelia beijingensis]